MSGYVKTIKQCMIMILKKCVIDTIHIARSMAILMGVSIATNRPTHLTKHIAMFTARLIAINAIDEV